jgi:BirA family biotin operon repressor/biotin-[acetyl-CoA-carboxylase] ligase
MHRPLTAADLFPGGPLVRLGGAVYTLDTVDSTNSYLLERAETLADGTVVTTEYQTGGRGRLGRRWETPRGAGLIVSVLLIEPASGLIAGSATLAAAVAAVEAIETLTDVRAHVRWPNDVAVGGRKLGGVLAEVTPLTPRDERPAQPRAVVLGLGLNCLQHRGHFAPELAQRATSLELESAQPVERAALATEVLRRLDHWIVTVGRAGGTEELLRQWKGRCEELGTHITVQRAGRQLSGTVLDIEANGDLVLQVDEGGRQTLAAATTTRAW